ncbi:MAG TPA: CocE/NonD family hydrolase [Acidimicrobiales bacterium]|nr:CocE/NonD family hydrolase [Acidimicrobiales bacterium]
MRLGGRGRRRLGLAAVMAAVAGVLAPLVARAASFDGYSGPNAYVRVSDGTSIALNIQTPAGRQPAGGWPTIIVIDGYEGASAPLSTTGAPVYAGGHYVVVHMSIRGTGCSGGRFDLFDQRSARDGYEIIEWLAHQKWSNGKVAIWGHSYSGLEGWLVAATRPPHLVAATLSGLIDDLYKGISDEGGVSNTGFPLLWTLGYRPLRDVGAGTGSGVVLNQDPVCAANQAGRVPPDVADSPVPNYALSLGEDSQWFISHSLITYLDGINVPIELVQTYQDEQTGPRGTNLLFQRLEQRKPGLPKRLLLTNGYHDTTWQPPELHHDRMAWLDCYVRNLCTGDILNPAHRVKVFWEMHPDRTGALVSNGVTADRSWPLSTTRWTRYFFGAGGRLATARPSPREGSDPYLAGSGRAGAWTDLPGQFGASQSLSGNAGQPATDANLPDEVRYQTAPFAASTAIAGPIDVTLYASSTAPDTEFYVELSDVDAKGRMTRLQRGMLKASHRAIDPSQTDYDAAGDIIRPFHPDTNTLTALVTPGQVVRYEIEVFPVGHVFRPGHRLLLRVTAPPASDSLNFYTPTTPPAVDTIFHDAAHPSSVLLPFIPLDGTTLGPALPCGAQVGLERCGAPLP